MKKRGEQKFKKPNLFVYAIFYTLSKILSKLVFKLKVYRNELKKVKKPYIIIANHESSIDFITLAGSIRRRLNFVISNSFYQSLKVNPFLKACGVIPKQQFQTNPSDMKKMKRVIDAGRPLVIYPAGLMTENGITTYIPKSTAKFLKWLDIDVYVAKTTGSYLTNPKWGKGFRKGRITMDIYKLLSQEELRNYDINSLYELIYNELYFNAYDIQEKDMIKYKKGNNISGLENVIYWCPKCNKEFAFKQESYDTMKCIHCGNEIYLDEYGFLHGKTEDDKYYKKVSDWSLKIYDNVYHEVTDTVDYSLKQNVEIQMLNYKKHQFESVGKGVLQLNQFNFILKGIINEKQKEISIPTKLFQIVPFKPGKYLELQDGNTIYRCCFENGIEVTKWINVLKVFYSINNKNEK